MNNDGRIESRDLCSSSVIERVLSDEAVSSIKIKKTIQSDNYSAGVSGWQINRDTGSCEFQNATIRGTLNASDLVAGTINAATITITNLNATNISTGTLSVARIGANSIDMSKIELVAALETSQELRSSSYTAGSSGWRIQANGAAEFNSVTVRGTIIAGTSSSIDWSYIANVSVTNAQIASLAASKITAGTISAQEIILSNSTSSILRSSNFVAGSAGWRIRGDGVAEFQNVTIRGTLNASDLTAGTLAVARIGAASIDMSKIELTAALETSQLIRSTVYTAGSAGWQISANGNAEFNNVTVRGTLGANSINGWLTTTTGGGFRTASSGARIEIGTAAGSAQAIYIYSGGTNPAAWIANASGSVRLSGAGGSSRPFLDMFDSVAAAASFEFNCNSRTDRAAVAIYRGSGVGSLRVQGSGASSVPIADFRNSSDTQVAAVMHSGTMVASGGSVSAPSFSFIGDPNTGMYSAAADHLQFTAGGTQYLQIDNAATSVMVDNAGFGVGVGFGNTLTAGFFYNAPPTTGTSANATWLLASGVIYYLNRVSSSKRYKTKIVTADWLADVELRPVRYWSKPDKQEQYGLIAEEVVEALGDAAGSFDDEGRVDNFSDRAVIAVLLAKVNRLEDKVAVLEAA